MKLMMVSYRKDRIGLDNIQLCTVRLVEELGAADHDGINSGGHTSGEEARSCDRRSNTKALHGEDVAIGLFVSSL